MQPFAFSEWDCRIRCVLVVQYKFDLQFFYAIDIFPENVYDTMLAEYILYNGVNSVDLERVYNDMCTNNHLSAETRLNYLKRAKFGWSSLQALVWKYYTVFLSKEERTNFKDYLSTEFLNLSVCK